MKYSYLVIYFTFMAIVISDFPTVYSYWEVLLTYCLIFFIAHFSCYFFHSKLQFYDIPSVYGVTVALALVLNGRDVVVLSYSNLFLYLAIFALYVFLACYYLSFKLGCIKFYYGIKADIKFMLSTMAVVIIAIAVYSFFADFSYDFFASLIVLSVVFYCIFVFIIYLCVGRGKATPLK
ncbi:hypothetical protein [Rheinheimera pacifica]|uniref:hypothetical protein n=1 Tax=Rheinheimera pacifica TaxID=173990 RepID=UPI002ED7DA0B